MKNGNGSKLLLIPRWVIGLLVVPTFLAVGLVAFLLVTTSEDDRRDHAEIARLQRALDVNRYNSCVQRVENKRIYSQIGLVMKGFVNERLGITQAELEDALVRAIESDPLDAPVPDGTGPRACPRP